MPRVRRGVSHIQKGHLVVKPSNATAPRWLQSDHEREAPASPSTPKKPYHALPGLPPPKRPGRPKGSVNRNTVLLRDAVMMAADLAGKQLDKKNKDHLGLVRYLKWLAINEPSSFVSLLGRIIPLQIDAKIRNEMVTNTRSELLQILSDRGLPVQSIFDLPPEDYKVNGELDHNSDEQEASLNEH